MNDQELFMQAQQINQEMQRVVQHRKAIEDEFNQSSNFLDQLSGLSENPEKILAPLSHGIYVPSITEKKNLIVQVGAGILVERKMSEVKELLERNLSQLQKANLQLQAQEEFYTQQLQHLLSLAEKNQEAVQSEN